MSDAEEQLSLVQYFNEIRQDESKLETADFINRVFQHPAGKDFLLNRSDLATVLFSGEPKDVRDLALYLANNPQFLLKESGIVKNDMGRDEAEKIMSSLPAVEDKTPFSVPAEEFQTRLQKQQVKSAKQREYVSKLVDAYAKNLRAEQRQAVLNEFSKPTRSTILDEARKEYAERIRASALFKNEPEAIAEIDEILGKSTEEILTVARQSESAVREYLQHPDSPPALVDAVLDNTFTSDTLDPVRVARLQYAPTVEQAGHVPLKQAFPEYKKNANETVATDHAFSVRVQAILEKEDGVEKLTEKIGRNIADSGTIHDLLKKSNQAAIDRSGGKWHNIVQGATSTITARSYEDTENILVGHFRMAPNISPTPDTVKHAMAFANHPELFHFEFDGILGRWLMKAGKKEAKSAVVEKAGAAALAKKLGIGFLTKIGAPAWLIAYGSTPVGWIIYAATIFLPGILKNVGSAAASKMAGGGLGSIQAASGAIAGVVQNALGTHYKDPNEKNIMLLALTVAVLPFLLIFLTTSMHINMQRAQFLPIGVEGGMEGDNPQQFNLSITATPVAGTGSVPSAISYTISISALNPNEPLTINSLSVSFSVFGGTGSPTLATVTIPASSISGGSFTFSVPITQQYNNSLVTATVTASTSTVTQPNVSGTASASTIIGTPPTGCFVFGPAGQPDAYGHTSSAWDDQSNTLAAIAILAASPDYLTKYVCIDGPITLYRVKESFGGGSTSGSSTIFLYNACVTGSQACMTYTMAHESGHIVNNRSASPFDSFHSQGISNREGYMWTYPNCLTESEDFAETLGNYVVWKYYNYGNRSRSADCGGSHSGGPLNYPQAYPLHYQFAKGIFGIEY